MYGIDESVHGILLRQAQAAERAVKAAEESIAQYRSSIEHAYGISNENRLRAARFHELARQEELLGVVAQGERTSVLNKPREEDLGIPVDPMTLMNG